MKKKCAKQTCSLCGGSFKVTAWFRENKDDKEGLEKIVDCLNTGTPDEIWESLCFLLQQFIRCKADTTFKPGDPYKEKCEGCACEREQILSLAWHYAQAVKTESSNRWTY
jgi:hypothetical protein